ncbi:MAG: hypothetical protein COX80_02365 [Candidatus Magasanikbacteria bacterium CG_4_10_14_0_2_um_filter_33_14]|uniref:Uncharacterized protein n=1 Tax=Candidatus Magasanikbacteria bacterium CG_4_10_14_0_2_um_filter_33_14 TaxID=1974636 RepID=A0A2M7VAY0_9BACT|nr:MAG: hypothetical protein COX80_02365 [Candidatus Magasanikbacteria bacterium CG_4_10_14_0_2_um_filter_33_14]
MFWLRYRIIIKLGVVLIIYQLGEINYFLFLYKNMIYENMILQTTIKLNGKAIFFYNHKTAHAVYTKEDNDFNLVVKNFIKQFQIELEKILFNFDNLEIFLTTKKGPNKLNVHEEFNNDSNKKIGRIFINLGWFLGFKNK